MGLFHRKGKQLKTKQDLREWWEQRITDDAPQTTKTPTNEVESHLHDEGQDGQDENDADRGNVGQSDKTVVTDVHEETTAEDGTSEAVNEADEAATPHVDDVTTGSVKATEDVESVNDAVGVEATTEVATADADVRSQTVHNEPDETETGSVERPTDIPATPVTDAVAGRSDEIPHLEVSTISADEADAASITSTFGAQANNATQETEQSADDEVTES